MPTENKVDGCHSAGASLKPGQPKVELVLNNSIPKVGSLDDMNGSTPEGSGAMCWCLERPQRTL